MLVTKAALIVNPAAGVKGGEPIEDVRARLEPALAVTVYETTSERDADVCAREAIAAGAELVIAAGGDGTVSAVAGVLAGGEVALGIIPRGTSNSIARALGIPDDDEGACALLRAGTVRMLDTARCGDRIMVLHCSVGLHAETIGDTSREAKNRWGALAYLAEGVRKLTQLEPFDVELETEAHVVRCQAITVTAANLAPIRTLLAQGPAAVVGDDGLLAVTVVASSSLLEVLGAGLHLLRTAAQHEPATRDDVGFFACKTLQVRATPPQQVLVDGEPVGTTPIAISCWPASLRMIAPAAPEESSQHEAKLIGLPHLELERKS